MLELEIYTHTRRSYLCIRSIGIDRTSSFVVISINRKLTAEDQSLPNCMSFPLQDHAWWGGVDDHFVEIGRH